jgi:hypothetical protein
MDGRSAFEGAPELSAEGIECLNPMTGEVAGEPHSWLERRLCIRSFQLAQAGERGLRARLAMAQAAIAVINECHRRQRRYLDASTARVAADEASEP